MKKYDGFIALSSVLMLSAIFLSLSISIAFQAISGSKNASISFEGRKAEMLAKDCVEYALIKLQDTLNYQGNESILFGTGLCTINQITGVGNTNRTIETQGIYGEYTNRIVVVVEEISPITIIASYRLVAQF